MSPSTFVTLLSTAFDAHIGGIAEDPPWHQPQESSIFPFFALHVLALTCLRRCRPAFALISAHRHQSFLPMSKQQSLRLDHFICKFAFSSTVQSASIARSQVWFNIYCGSSPGRWAILQLVCSQARRKLQEELPPKRVTKHWDQAIDALCRYCL